MDRNLTHIITISIATIFTGHFITQFSWWHEFPDLFWSAIGAIVIAIKVKDLE